MTCTTGKIAYPSPQAAWTAAGRVTRRIRTTATVRRGARAVHAYRCQFCGAYHLSGTPDPRKRNA